jgi:hypothetical protein
VNILSTRTHGMLDYLMGAVLLVAPYVFGFADNGAAQWVPMVLGVGAIAYSLLTRYELGVVKLLPMPVHLVMDAASGLLLAASPWLFGFSALVWVPHVVFGLLELGSSLITRAVPEADIAISGQPGE